MELGNYLEGPLSQHHCRTTKSTRRKWMSQGRKDRCDAVQIKQKHERRRKQQKLVLFRVKKCLNTPLTLFIETAKKVGDLSHATVAYFMGFLKFYYDMEKMHGLLTA